MRPRGAYDSLGMIALVLDSLDRDNSILSPIASCIAAASLPTQTNKVYKLAPFSSIEPIRH